MEHLERCTEPMVDLGTYKIKILDIGKTIPKESFTDSYVEQLFESENVCTYIK